MDLINTLLLLSELGSKIGNVDLENEFLFNMQEFNKLNNLSFIKDMPVFDNSREFITINSQKAPVGTILKRPLDNPFQRLTQFDIEYHYAVVLGTAVDGRELLIEMTKSRDVNIVTKKGFLVDKFAENDVLVYFLPKRAAARDNIVKRARNFEFSPYDLLDLNCKVFAEFIVQDIPVPKRRIGIKKLQLHLCDIKMSIYRLKLSNPDNEEYYDYIKNKLFEAEVDKERLLKAIDEDEK